MEHLKSSTSGTATFYSTVDHVERIYGYTRLERYPIVIAAGYNKMQVFSNRKVDSTIYTAIALTLQLIMSSMGAIMLKQIKINEKNQLDLTKVRDQLTVMNHTLETLALLDGLTGLANRRQFDIFLRETIAQSALSGKRIALIMLDVDMFKKCNDHYGHVEGDKCLQTVSHALSSMQCRKEDLIARYGGEEFVIILMDVTEEGAVAFAERALEAIRHQRIPHELTTLDEKVVTASAGVYLFVGTTPDHAPESVIIRADKALYQAKSKGRNSVEIAT
ncbi:diguanylate cyclase [Candidatus Symbiopectobacterium sp.]|uniref:sensor domain-containing diguanylate cyclase n=1 Tax=Candidatus Symbiopectobacterium sp. TaxID=2816440 RepID=UPI0025C08F2D|nr:diguanylate cyclase [Candidatus Symbiopectobacterium sp.]